MAEERAPVQQRVGLREHQRDDRNRASANKSPDGRLQTMGENSFRWLAVEAEGKHQVCDGERRDDRNLARLSCKPKPD